MIQTFWLIDFIGIFLSRLIISIIFINLFLKKFSQDKILSFIYLISAICIFLGLYTSFFALMWIFALFLKLIKEKRANLLVLSLISYFIILLSVGPGKLSVDRMFDIRY